MYKRTSSVLDPKDGSVVYVRSLEWLNRLAEKGRGKKLMIVAPKSLSGRKLADESWSMVCHAHPKREFVLLHNMLNEDIDAPPHSIHPSATIAPCAIVGAEGLNTVLSQDNKLISMKHMGNVVIEEGASIGSLSVIARAVFGSTTIGAYTHIGNRCSIGHGATLGRNVIVAPNATIGGSVRIGDGCFIGMGAVVNNWCKLCRGVIIGSGAVVTKDITGPGKYVGVPAKWVGEWKGEW